MWTFRCGTRGYGSSWSPSARRRAARSRCGTSPGTPAAAVTTPGWTRSTRSSWTCSGGCGEGTPAMIDRLRGFVRRHRSLFVFGSGIALGAVVTLLVSAFVVPLFDSSDRLEPGDLVILSGRDDGQGNQRQALVEEWNALHPQNQARIDSISAVADAQHSEMVARAQSGGAKVDIYNLDVTWTAEFASAGYIR